MIDPKTFLISIFNAAVAAADPEKTIRNHLPAKPKGRTIVIGAGKGSAQMAAAFEKVWDGPINGLVVTRYGYGAKCERIEIIEAAHPVPDGAGLEASRRLLEKVRALTADDLVVALISGGGSALLPSPAPGLTLADEIAVNEALLASGAPIAAMNTIRKHVSTIKGGRLAAAAHPARVVSLVVSDIPGDNPALVASGPTVPDTGSREDALASIAAYGMKLPASVMAHINSPAADAPRPNDLRFAGNEVHLTASAGVSLEAAAAEAKRQGIEAVILSDAIEGEAREVGGVHAAIAREVATRNRPFAKPVLILSGGETTVTLRAKGKGGRNSEFLLAFAIGIDGIDGIHALAADTDGIDGSENNAGAFADGSIVSRMRAAGIDAKAMLAGNNAWTAFNAVGDLFVPGPTGTNVNDLRAILVR
ncbi:glycerate kinase [Mesorhizobium sp. M2D.F.Ca.ET.185.01.1.1]|uniref:glycerate kinase type-2 family protein n=2 Tax=Mesorhizobium TaxID=68287 RepID=UPI000FCBAEA8|nr:MULTISPECIES: glycerate kinase [unclassified Mesorhizobium]TGP82221.1 glycerate kinase [bacterium M00.F.Ca.ET.227.01.1.1]TGP91895.1 glycerate kinase [bacterium M00.F.Ca.ET.221.01.1.1]TGP95319.1 glycerate kinase [bacterium M00.F.Ca.ET.222.01.1.1]TGU09577.1 glycerate kinase [bacterium M00.F.Ca.ET.163.01.1.1]TGU38751.1 glycerate kinase [bacterium M00.F.Ca.ET.156.01.1.1]TGU47903.1 glycerate kinase [bacterium M00.F.Ca.ET.146.01.1.1]TGV69386.1 glycerate kinase [Mesorhizobium sp. M2D.F.Ca.ET.160